MMRGVHPWCVCCLDGETRVKGDKLGMGGMGEVEHLYHSSRGVCVRSLREGIAFLDDVPFGLMFEAYRTGSRYETT